MTGLTFGEITRVYNDVRARLEPTYKFRLPNLDLELDIRDYQFKEACGSYFLVRKADPVFKPELNEWLFTLPYKPTFHPAHFIWLQGCTSEQAAKIREFVFT